MERKRSERAREILRRLEEGPAFSSVFGEGAKAELKNNYRLWAESWVLEQVRELIPELTAAVGKLVPATKREEDAYAKTRPIYPLVGWTLAKAGQYRDMRCPVEFVGQRDDEWRYEVMAPEGHRFTGGEHSLLCASAADLATRIKADQLSECPSDCECGGFKIKVK